MNSEPLIIKGIQMPPGCRPLTPEESANLTPDELGRSVRYYQGEQLLFAETTEFKNLLAVLNRDEKDLRRELHALLHPHGIWAHSSKPSGQNRGMPRASFLLRPPFLETEREPPADRLAPYPHEAAFVLHSDQNHVLEAIRSTRGGKEVDRTIQKEIFKRRSTFRHEYGQWENIASMIAGVLLNVRSEFLTSFASQNER